MREHVEADEPFERTDVTARGGAERFAAEGQDYKVELIRDLVADEGVETVSLYRNGPFTDLCRGPHAPSTGRIKAFKLLSLAGAYWRGDERNKMLTRIYGTAFFSKKDLEQPPRDARAGTRPRPPPARAAARPVHAAPRRRPACRSSCPNGMAVVNEIQRVVREQLASARLPARSARRTSSTSSCGSAPGHWDNYRENMFFTQDQSERPRQFAVKPMNCPGACLVFGSERHSYRDLPLRLAEFGLCTRNEREGVLHGLLRVRAFTQDDAHVYCTEDQIVAEVRDIVEAIDELYALFGFDDVRVELSTRPGEVDRHGRAVGDGGARAAGGARGHGARVQAQPRRRRLLRPEDRLPHHRRARPLLAVRHVPARLLHAAALRPHLHGAGRQPTHRR